MSEVWKVECTKEKKRNSSFLIFYGHVPLLLALVECFLFVFLLKGLKRHFPPSAEGLAIFLRSFRLPCEHGDLILNGKLRRTSENPDSSRYSLCDLVIQSNFVDITHHELQTGMKINDKVCIAVLSV